MFLIVLKLATFTILGGIPNLTQVHNKMWHLRPPSPRTESHHLMTLMTSPQVTRAEREWVKPDRSIASPPLPPGPSINCKPHMLPASLHAAHHHHSLSGTIHMGHPPFCDFILDSPSSCHTTSFTENFFILRSRFGEVCSCCS